MRKVNNIEQDLLEKMKGRIWADLDSSTIFVYNNVQGLYKVIKRPEELFLMLRWIYKEQPDKLKYPTKQNISELFFQLVTNEQIQKPIEDFDDKRSLLLLENGVLNCKDGTLHKFSHKYLFLNKSPVCYKKQARPREFLRMVNIMFTNKKDKKMFLEIVSYLISPFTTAKLGFVFRGDAHTGKSSMARLMSKFIPKNKVTNLNMDDLNGGDAFKRKQILESMLVYVDETDNKEITKTSTLKALIACENMYGESKGIDGYSKRCHGKLLVVTNAPLKIQASQKDNAIMSRFVFLPFEVALKRKEWVMDIDKKLFKSERDEIFSFLVKYMIKLHKNNFEFTKSNRSLAMEKEFIGTEDSFKLFMNKCCVLEKKAFVHKSDCYKYYVQCCKEHEIKPLSETEFKDKMACLSKVRGDKKCRRRDSNGKSFGNAIAVYYGIRVKDKYTQNSFV